MLDFSMYKGKRVLVTGHTGFKGSWLVLILRMLGAKVIGYSLPLETTPDMFTVLGLEKEITHIIGDIRDLEHFMRVCKEETPEIVFHCAAQPLVRLSYQEPVSTYATNIMGTVHVLETIRHTKSIRSAVIVTSDKCYKNKEMVYGYREIDPMGGDDPYSSSKGCAELVTHAYQHSFFLPSKHGVHHTVGVASVRAGNVIGGGDWSLDRLVPDCIRALIHEQPIVLRNPRATRPWQHVLEPLFGYLFLGSLLYENAQKYSSAWNFGPTTDANISVQEVVEYVIRFWGKGSYTFDLDKHVHEAQLLKLDISKTQQQLGWHPCFSIQQSLEATVQWYQTFYNKKENIRAFSEEQINTYRKHME